MTGDVVELLCELIALPSVNPESDRGRTDAPYGEGRVADYVERFFEPFGLNIERQEAVAGRENVLVHVPGEDLTASPVLVHAHMDTVDVHGMDTPFTARIEKGRVYGRGACDDKASLAAGMTAVKELLEEGVKLPRGCVFVAGADEEYDMMGSVALAAAGKAYCGAIVCEPTSLNIAPVTNGQMYFKIKAHGKAVHSSRPELGVNAIYLMTEVIDLLRSRAVSLYPERHHPLCGSPQLTVSIIQGGVSEHIVPDTCEITLDRRIIPGERGDEAFEEIKSWLSEGLDTATLSRVDTEMYYKNQPPLDTPLDHPLVQGLTAAVEDVVGEANIVGVRGNTDASNLSEAGIPSVVFGPGGGGSHSTVEYAEIEQLTAAVKILKRFLREASLG
jgi:acetylornithine deacetylase